MGAAKFFLTLKGSVNPKRLKNTDLENLLFLGDTIHADESSLIILNHRTRLDWNFLWAALFHATSPPALNAKLVLKNQIRKIPGIGKY